MIKVRNLGLLLALSSVALLPACSMFGGGSDQSSSAAARSQAYAPPPPAAAANQQAAADTPVTPDTIRQVQQALQQQGMYHARVDGVWGPATEGAVRSYQQKNNLNASGQLDPQTLASLNLGNNNQNYGSNNNNSNQQPNNQASNDNGQNQQPNAQNYSNQTPPANQPNTTTTR